MISRKQWQFLLTAAALTALSVLLLSCGGSQANVRNDSPAASPSPAAVDVTTAPAIQRQLPRYFEATGSLAADAQTDVAPQAAGKVVAVGVDLGTFVRRGQMLAKLDDADFRIRVEQAVAALDQTKAAVAQTEAKIGLKADQTFDPEQVADVASARFAYQLAEKNQQRAEKLIEAGDVSRSYYDLQKTQRDQLKAQYESALATARQNYAAVQVARTNVTAAQSAVSLARSSLSYTVISSPMAGYVAERQVDVGEYVTTASKVATVVRVNPLRMRIEIPEQSIPNIQAGQGVSLVVSAWPDRSFNGRIARISPNVTASSRTLAVEAEVENSDGSLKPGQFATVRILQAKAAPAVLIPARAVRTESGVSRVFVIKNGRAEQRLVQLGQTEGDLIEIKQGIAAAEQVATSNLAQLSDGMAVRQ
jgi:multidrug efflux pump subunit AcrA (membrane-fusion protein)